MFPSSCHPKMAWLCSATLLGFEHFVLMVKHGHKQDSRAFIWILELVCRHMHSCLHLHMCQPKCLNTRLPLWVGFPCLGIGLSTEEGWWFTQAGAESHFLTSKGPNTLAAVLPFIGQKSARKHATDPCSTKYRGTPAAIPAGGEGRVWSCCKKPWLACSTGTQGEEQPNWIYQVSNDTAGLEHDQDRNMSDSISPWLDLQCLGSGNTWDNWNSILKDGHRLGRRCGCCWAGLGAQPRALVLCSHQVLPPSLAIAVPPWSLGALHFPGECKGQWCSGIVPFQWEAKPTRNLGAPGVQFPAQSIKQTLTATEKILGFWRPQFNFGLRWWNKMNSRPFLLPLLPLCKIPPGPTREAGFAQESKKKGLSSKIGLSKRKLSFRGNRKPFNFRARLTSISKNKRTWSLGS